MSLFIPIDRDQVKECQLCGQPIVFVERREGGLWFPTDAIQDDEGWLWGYNSRGSQKEVSLLHKCYGDPKDPTTVNGRQAEFKALTDDVRERLADLERRKAVSTENDKFNEEYNKIVNEYAEITERFSDIIPPR